MLALSGDVIHRRHSLRLSLFAPRRLVVSPRSSCRGTGRGRCCLLRFAGVVLVMRCGFGAVAMPCLWLSPSSYCLVWDDGGDCFDDETGGGRSATCLVIKRRLTGCVVPRMRRRLVRGAVACLMRGGRTTRETGSRTGRGRLLDGFVLYEFMRSYIPGVLVIYLAFLLYLSHSCYISGILVICLVFLLYQFVSCYTILYE